MAVVPVVPVLFIVLIARSQSEPTNGLNYNNNGNEATQYGSILKPPPPPPLPIFPVPFHGGTGRIRQNNNQDYQYQSPPPTQLPLPISPSPEFKFPAPFYKQYNFNFVPPPQPFTTTPSPNLFQKISGWLFPSQQTSSDLGAEVTSSYISPSKRDCNPCNLVPWIPVIRYDLTSNNLRQNNNPTYGPPSPTTTTNFITSQNVPQSFNNNNNKANHVSPGIPHANYGPPPVLNLNNNQNRIQSSTYGPPSPTHIVTITDQAPGKLHHSSSIYEGPNTSYESFSTQRFPSTQFKHQYDSTYTTSSFNNNFNNQYVSSSHNPISVNYKAETLNQHLPIQNDMEIINDIEPSEELKLPKVSQPKGFRNSYGEPIVNTYGLDIPYPATATGAASSKVKTEVLPDYNSKFLRPNMSMALANPAPFSLNRGRNIHTLQPVALPNLSVSPLPPIFNARPFRPIATNYSPSFVYGLNHLQVSSSNVNIEKSVPILEYTHSIEYPTTIIQSPIIDIDKENKLNQSKAYRNIGNNYEIDEIPQASEDHVSAANTNHESTFESIGYNNDLDDSEIPLDLKQAVNAPFNHKASFADLRGLKDEDIDKYRTESNLQYIDSPLLYLKPSAPHKNFKNFVYTTTSMPAKQNEYEIYDEYTPTTSAPAQTTSNIDENRSDYAGQISQYTTAENKNHPKIIQIIVPYTSGQRIDDNGFKNGFTSNQQDYINEEYQGRKVQSNTENTFYSFATEGISSVMTTTEQPISTFTDQYDNERINTPAMLNDLYDVKEPPFDIIKLQHTIDDWTEQEYSKHYRIPHRTRPSEKFAKQIPDEYFTTISPVTNYATDRSYNYDIYDHEFSSSIQHTVTDNRTKITPINRKDYNTLERTKTDYSSAKNEESESNEKLHIYTAASSFRKTTTTTPAPWGMIQTSISPLTNEKVYVVTSKPWREKNSSTEEYDYEDDKFNSQKTEIDDSSEQHLPFKSPRFSNRPSYGFTADAIDSIRLDSPYGFSKGWHRRINNLDHVPFESNDHTSYEEDYEKESQTAKVKEKQ